MTVAAHHESAVRRAIVLIGDLLGAAAIIVGIPVVIFAIGIPIALIVRLLLWVSAQI
jgi:hypothetical protein